MLNIAMSFGFALFVIIYFTASFSGECFLIIPAMPAGSITA